MNGLTLLVYIVLLIGTVILRTYLQLWGIDMGTGFYYNTGGAALIFNVLLVAAIAAFLILPLVKKPTGTLASGRVVSVAKIFMGFVVEVMAFTDLIGLFFGSDGGGSMLVMITMILSVVAGLVFVFDGFSGLSEQKKTEQSLFTAALPSVWLTFLVLNTFMSYKLTIEISDNMLHILATVLVLLFFTASAKIALDASKKYTLSWAAGTGMAASFFCFVLSVPRLISGTLGASFTEGPSAGATLIMLTLGIYTLVSSLPLLKNKS